MLSSELYSRINKQLSDTSINELIEMCQKNLTENPMDSLAMYNLSQLYEMLCEYNKAEEWFLKALELKNEYTIDYEGCFYYTLYYKIINKGKFHYYLNYLIANKFLKKAEYWYLQGAKENKHESMYWLAIIYEYDLKNTEKAEYWYKKSIEIYECVQYLKSFALFYKYVRKDCQKAEECLQKALKIEPDNSDLYYTLAGVQTNTENQEKWFLKAIELGNRKSIQYLILLYYYTLNDMDKAYKMFDKLNDTEKDYFSYCLQNTMLSYEKKILEDKKNNILDKKNNILDSSVVTEFEEIDNIVKNAVLEYNNNKDYKKAEEVFIKAAEKGSVQAMYNLGLIYIKVKNNAKSLEWFTKASDLGHINSMNNIGAIWYNKDKQKADKWFVKAAELGSRTAMYNIGLIYYCNKEYDKANVWFNKNKMHTNFEYKGLTVIIS